MNGFPQPIRLSTDDGTRQRQPGKKLAGTNIQRQSGTSRWRLSDILAFEASRSGAPAPRIEPQADRYLTANDLAERFRVADSTIWRWTMESARAARDEAA